MRNYLLIVALAVVLVLGGCATQSVHKTSSSLDLGKSSDGNKSFTFADLEDIEDAVTDNDTRITAIEDGTFDYEIVASAGIKAKAVVDENDPITSAIDLTEWPNTLILVDVSETTRIGLPDCSTAERIGFVEFKCKNTSEVQFYASEDPSNDVLRGPGVATNEYHTNGGADESVRFSCLENNIIYVDSGATGEYAGADFSGNVTVGGSLNVDGDTETDDFAASSGAIVNAMHSDFGITDDGSTDNTSAVQAAVTAAAGNKLVFPKLTYPIKFSDVALSGSSIEIDLNGNTIVPVDGNPVFELTGGFSNSTSVSAIGTATVDSIERTTVSVADASAFAVGDVVKVVSTDDIPNNWGTNRKIGEFSEIIVITEGAPDVITLNSKLFDHSTYANNITIATIYDVTFKIYNGYIDNSGGYEQNGAIIFSSARDCELKNVHAKNLEDAFFIPLSLYRYHVDACSVINSENDTGNSKYGYGILDKGSHNGLITNFVMNKGRHAFTTDGYESASADMRTGRSFGTRIVDGVSYDAEAGGWDTHPSAAHVTFENCKAYGGYAFGQSRSPYTQFINPIGRDLTYGIKWTSGTGGTNPLVGQKVINPYLSVSNTMFEHYYSAALQLTSAGEITIIGGEIEINNSATTGCVLKSDAAPIDLLFKNVSIKLNDIDTYAMLYFDQATADYSKITAVGNTVNMASVDTATAMQWVRFDSDASGDDPYVVVGYNTFYGSGTSILQVLVYNTDAYLWGNVTPPGHASFVEIYTGDSQTFEDVVMPPRSYDYSDGLIALPTESPTATDACTVGEITWDASYIYICTATGVWKRAALTGGY